MKALLIMAGVLVGVPAVAAVGVQLYTAVMVAGVAMDIQESMDAAKDAEVVSDKYRVENVKGDANLTDGYDALVNIAAPHRERRVTFNAYVKIRDFLKPGEERPDADFADVFVSARANAFADAECGRLMKKLASKCSVSWVSADRVAMADGVYNISATLAFVQKDPFGSVDETALLAYREVRDDLAPGGKPVTVMPAEAARQREKFYEDAARTCAKMRKTEGNCAIYRVDINANQKDGSDAVEFWGKAQFSFLQALSS